MSSIYTADFNQYETVHINDSVVQVKQHDIVIPTHCRQLFKGLQYDTVIFMAATLPSQLHSATP